MNLISNSISFSKPGAIAPPENSLDQGVPWHYGDPLREQLNLIEKTGLVDLSHLSVLQITGEDRTNFLHSLTSAHFLRAKEKDSFITLILSPHGHIEHLLKVIIDKERIWLIVEPSAKEQVLKYLNSMIFMSKIEIFDVSNEYAVLFDALHEIQKDLPTWLTPENFANKPIVEAGFSAGGDPNKYLKARPAIYEGREYLVKRDELNLYLDQAEQLAGTWALEAIRVAAGVVREGLDFDHKTLPHEVGLIGTAVHLEKGCYRGQETVARVHNLGRPPRKLALLHLDGFAERLPKVGSEVNLAGEKIGISGSAVRHYEFGPIALALVKSKIREGAEIEVDSIAGSLQEIVSLAKELKE
jgi:tRNA-modifying protein YgfZ